jgi:D-cysteine desulfhydrase/L-cysteate sulfo-lyase
MLADKYHRVELSHTPTPLELLKNLTKELEGPQIWVKRDDCTGLAMGGNKARQLEYYIGHGVSLGADTLLTTGAVQSNHVRMTIAAARKLGMDVEVQLEKRVDGRQQEYYDSGNPFLMKLMGAKIHHYPVGEDEDGADRAMYERAEQLKKKGRKPYVIPLSGNHTPFGALGYVQCAEELLLQAQQRSLKIDAVVLATGSATTHSGLLSGLRALGSDIPVYGFCVRRDQNAQAQRVLDKTREVTDMIECPGVVNPEDVWVDDRMLRPGYGQLNPDLLEAIEMCASSEGLLLDPTYTGKAMAGLIDLVRNDEFEGSQNIVFLHTGGTPALFGYPEILNEQNDQAALRAV